MPTACTVPFDAHRAAKIPLCPAPHGWVAPPKKDAKKKKKDGGGDKPQAANGGAGPAGAAGDVEMDPEKAAKKVGGPAACPQPQGAQAKGAACIHGPCVCVCVCVCVSELGAASFCCVRVS